MLHLLVKVQSVSEPRTLTTTMGEQSQIVDVTCSSGSDTFIASAFDKMAVQVLSSKPVAGALYWVDLSFFLGGRDKNFQNVRIVSMLPF